MSSQDSLVSVIVPVYNAQDRLERAAHSVLDQDYGNVELILVDDGSADRSPEILAELAAADSRVKVITQPNGGVSSARNAGLRAAKGEYVAFLDADDWFADGAIKRLVETVEKDGSQAVRFGNYIFKESGTRPRTTRYGRTRLLTRRDDIEDLERALLVGDEPGYAWLFLIRAEIAKSAQFPEDVRIYEDLLWVLEILEKLDSLSIVGEPLLYYDLTGTSATRDSGRAEQIMRRTLVGEAAVIEAILKSSSADPEKLRAFLAARMQWAGGKLAEASAGTEQVILEQILEEFLRSDSVQLALQVLDGKAVPDGRGIRPSIRLDQDAKENAEHLISARGRYLLADKAKKLVTVPPRIAAAKVQDFVASRKSAAVIGANNPDLDHAGPGRTNLVWIQTMREVSRNYGCLLQAVALQRALRELGYVPITNAYSLPKWSWRTFPGYARQMLKTRSLTNIPTLTVRRGPFRKLDEFARENLELTDRNWGAGKSPWPRKYRDASYAVVGSDQVWRPQYVDVLWNTFDYLPIGGVPKRVSYAASFGLDDLSDFSVELREEFGRNLQGFAAVSIREESGTALCEDSWGVPAEHVVDPTMLLTKEDWLGYIAANPESSGKQNGTLAYMILDDHPELEQHARNMAAGLGLEFTVFYPPKVESHREYVSDPEKYDLPAVTKWLETLSSASLVITDSFHVSVFSILFETPFYTLKNHSRGATRFDSLGKMLALENQFLDEEELLNADSIPQIDWEKTGRLLEDRREQSKGFLRRALK